MQGNPTLVEVISYLPPAIGADRLILQRQNTNDLAKAIAKSHYENLKYAEKISHLFRGETDEETCENIWNFLKKYIPYSIEPAEKQATKSLPRMLNDARNGIGSDCKMYSVLTGTILQKCGIPFKYRLAGYSTNYPQHIYCVAHCSIVDGVLPYFNHEKKPYKYKKDMALYTMSGVDQIGKWEPKTNLGKKIRKATDKIQEKGEDLKKKAKDIAKDALKGAKIVAALVPRQAFLGLVSLNFRGLANRADKLRQIDPNSLNDLWVNKWGGDMAALNTAINDGLKKKPLFIKKSKVSGIDQIGLDPATITAIGGLILKATPLILGLAGLLKKNQQPSDDLTADIEPDGSDGDKYYSKDPGSENIPERDMTDEEKDKVADKVAEDVTGGSSTSTGINPILIVGAGAVALFLLTKKK
jgi:hypothetical protein